MNLLPRQPHLPAGQSSRVTDNKAQYVDETALGNLMPSRMNRKTRSTNLRTGKTRHDCVLQVAQWRVNQTMIHRNEGEPERTSS